MNALLRPNKQPPLNNVELDGPAKCRDHHFGGLRLLGPTRCHAVALNVVDMRDESDQIFLSLAEGPKLIPVEQTI